MPDLKSTCIDCGNPASGTRCKKCHGKHEALLAATLLAPEDEKLLKMVNDEGLDPARLGARLGVSRQSATTRLKRARARQKLLAEQPVG